MKAALDPGSERDETIERLMRTWQTPLLRLCYVQLKDRALAEDAVQETFVKAYRNWEQFRGESSEKNWLCKIAVNVCRDMQRGAGRLVSPYRPDGHAGYAAAAHRSRTGRPGGFDACRDGFARPVSGSHHALLLTG